VAKDNIVLVIGATGGMGSETALAFSRRGFRIRALHRRPKEAASQFNHLNFDWVKGDAMDATGVNAAAEGARFIVHGANPPMYRNWPKLVLPMLENTIAAARASGARILFPGTVYNFPPDAPMVLRENTPQRATTRKGAIRIEMERRLEEAQATGVRSLILRAGDFFGPYITGNSWFRQLVKPGRPVRTITYPGPPDIGHSWAYLPDVGETMALLAERDASLVGFEVVHFGGHWFERGIDMAEAIRAVVADPHLPIRSMPWWLVGAASPFVPLMRELWEMRYLWHVPMRLDNTKLVSVLGDEPHTPTEEAVRASLTGLACLSAKSRSPA
jgi:nucleoside-diphosphate-sugar epimerase